MPYCMVDDTKIYYEEEGQGETMLLVHGAAQDTLSWRFVVPFLSKKYRTVAVDLPGHGKSMRRGDGPVKSLEEYALFLNAFIDALKLGKVIIVGHSMGGGLSLQAGLNRPDQIRVVVPLDGAGTTRKDAVGYTDDILDLITVNPRDFWETLFISLCGQETSAERKRLIAIECMRLPTDVMLGDLRAFTSFDIRDKLKEIAFPVIFITGEDDYAVTPEMVKLSRSMVQSPTAMQVIGGVGHFPHMEAPEKVADALFRLLTTVHL
jgi:pimeloyl-ACP methyl ester carboxylesterase